MISSIVSQYVDIGDVFLIATLIAVSYLGIRSQRPRILKEENEELAEENKRLRAGKADWAEQKSEFVAQIRTLENRITILESKDTERLYDLMKSHDERATTLAEQLGGVLQGLSAQINSHIERQQEQASIVLPLIHEIQQHLGVSPSSSAE